MTDSEKIAEWEKHYSLLQTNESKIALFGYLKAQGDKVSLEVCRKLMERWLSEK